MKQVKNEKGITLISLIIYIIVLILVLSLLTYITASFNDNMKILENLGKNMPSFNKFNMYFIEDVKNNKDICYIDDSKIVFDDGTTYTYQDNNIYRNKTKICENIPFITFSFREETDDNDFTKKVITVQMVLKGTDVIELENDYVLKYW